MFSPSQPLEKYFPHPNLLKILFGAYIFIPRITTSREWYAEKMEHQKTTFLSYLDTFTQKIIYVPQKDIFAKNLRKKDLENCAQCKHT